MHSCLRSARRVWLATIPKGCLVAALSLLLGCFAEVSTSRGADSMSATNSNAARQQAIRAITLSQLQPEHRRTVRRVLADTTLYRRLPTLIQDCDPALFTFLAKNPEVLVEIWKELGIARVDLRRTGRTSFQMDDGAGTTGTMEIVEQKCHPQAQNRIVLLVNGMYRGKPFKQPLRAQAVLLMQSGSLVETNGRSYVAVRMDTFIRFERLGLELVAKVAHPLVGKMADRNFADTMQFISSFSYATETRPESIEQLVGKLQRVPRSQQDELIEITYRCSASAPDGTGQRRLAARDGRESL